jgi:polyhydroxyalkanoate synthase
MKTTKNHVTRWVEAPQPAETPYQRLDRVLRTSVSPLTGGLSPASALLALTDWALHFSASPGRQAQLMVMGMQLMEAASMQSGEAPSRTGRTDEDPRFRHEAWTAWPFNQLREGFHICEVLSRETGWFPGMTAHHAGLTQFFAKQWLGMMAPANWLPTNPVVLNDVVASNGAHLVKGFQNWLHDVSGLQTPEDIAQSQRFQVGRDVAITPGKVVYRNRLIELIRYEAQTDKVHPEPVLIIPSWIMKYYILDLSPENSMVRYLVSKGHTVFMLSWLNPDARERDLSLNDYLRLGVLDALRAVGASSDKPRSVHMVGYCLGGTLLAIAAAALARPGGMSDTEDLPAMRSLTLLAAQTDFSEPGELGLFIDESQIYFLDTITRGKGYLSGEEMSGSFQFLHSQDLVWTRRMHEYLMGERERKTDLTAWNADTTRMPARMHHDYLTALYLYNALASSAYRVEGRTVSLADIRAPIFLVATQRDHISPWRSVYKLHHLCDPETTFVLTSGGHNAGIVSEPGHANRHFQMATRAAHGTWIEPEQWVAQTPRHEGSWWPSWHQWLAQHSSRKETALAIPAKEALYDAPGQYVLQRHKD